MAEPIEKTGPATDVEHKAAEDAGKETVAHELKDSMGHVTQETWICCDGCGKWRSVPQELADSLDEEAAWYVALLLLVINVFVLTILVTI